MSKVFNRIKKFIPSKRKLIQLYSALLFNANIKGFFKGSIYQGGSKNLCAPGLNCYSCPGAVGACPLGSLQNALGSTPHTAAFYVIGILMLYAILLGRFICGFLCPFGLIQELLYKIKTPKLKKNKVTRILSYLKYVILVYFVVIVPVLYALYSNLGKAVPAFCKYICPAGVVEGAFGYLSHETNAAELSALGPLFTWKFCLLIGIVLGSVFVFRLFCRFLCPLGALYGLFNHFSVFGIKLEKSKCTDCGLCVSKCKMDIRHVNDFECINCGECIDVCPTKAISWKGSQYILPPNEIDNPIIITDESSDLEREQAELQKAEFEAKQAKIKKRNNILKYVLGGIMIALLAFALIYYNFIDTEEELPALPLPEQPLEEGAPPIGNQVGQTCPGYDMEIFDENGLTGEKFNPASNKGKITIINFWGTWCGGCIEELPFFNQIATEYKDKVSVVAVHTHMMFDTAADYVNTYYKDSDMVFTKDYPINSDNPYSPEIYFKALGGGSSYPITIILDEKGVIIATIMKSTTYDELKGIVETQLNK